MQYRPAFSTSLTCRLRPSDSDERDAEKSRQALLKMQKLQHLDLSKAIGFTVAHMRDLAGLPLLTSLIPEEVRGDDAVGPRALLAAVQNGQRLRLLDVSGHDGLDTHVLDALSTLTNLQELHLRSSGPAEGYVLFLSCSNDRITCPIRAYVSLHSIVDDGASRLLQNPP